MMKYWLICIMAFLPMLSHALDVEDLQSQGVLSVETWVSSGSKSQDNNQPLQVAIGEQVLLNIKIGTNRWFTGGTRIPLVELPNVIAKQREQFAVNSNERINGETWTYQLWQIALYPQETGAYQVPALPIDINVMSPNNGRISGQVNSQTVSFSAVLPSAELSQTQWFTSPSVEVEQTWAFSNEALANETHSESPLAVGDSITRQVKITAQDTLSIMLPDSLSNTALHKMIQTYRDPVVLDDTQQRGLYLSSRTDSQVMILQTGGELVLPEVTVTWWNPKTQQIEQAVLEGKTIAVKHTLSSFVKTYQWQVLIVAVAFALLITALLAAKRYYQSHPAPLWWQYQKALSQQQWPRVRTLLYRQVRQTNQAITLADGLDDSVKQDGEKLQQTAVSLLVARGLWQSISRSDGKKGLARIKAKLWPKALPKL